jgi:hypothetical protein
MLHNRTCAKLATLGKQLQDFDAGMCITLEWIG